MSNPEFDFWYIELEVQLEPPIDFDDVQTQERVQNAASPELRVEFRDVLGKIVTWSKYRGEQDRFESLVRNIQETKSAFEGADRTVTEIVSAFAVSGGYFEMEAAQKHGLFMEWRSIGLTEEANTVLDFYSSDEF